MTLLEKALAFVKAPMRGPRRQVLESEIAGADVTGVRPITSGHPAQGLTPVKLAAILRAAEDTDPTAYLELAEEMEEKDLHYGAVLGVRKRAIRGMEMIVEPASDDARDIEAAAFVEEQLREVATGMAILDMLDALGKGYSATEIVWKLDGPRWEVERLIWRDPRWFEIHREDGCSLLIREPGGSIPLPPAKFIVHHPKVKSGFPVRGGLARLAAWAYLFKNFTLRDWAIFCEAYGHPLRLGKYDTNPTEEEKRTLLRAVRNIGADMAAIVPKSMEIEFVSASLSGNAAFYEAKSRYWDEQLSKGVVGQVATTDAIAGGHAVGKVHDAVRSDIRDADAEQLAATLMRDLARPLTVFNFGPETGVPRLRFEAPDEIDIRDWLAGVEAMVAKFDMPVAQADVYRRFNLAKPGEDEDVIEPKKPAPIPPGLDPGKEKGDPQPPDEPVDPEEDEQQEAARLVQALLARQREGSALDDLVDAMMVEAGERPALGLGDIEAALESATSLEELKAALADAAATDIDQTQLVDLLARASSVARTAGVVGAEIEG